MDKVTIVGLGLIGGSLGLAIKKFIPDTHVTGYSRSPETVVRAKNIAAIDTAASDIKEAVNGAGLVIIATPILTVKDILEQIGPHLPAKCIVSDTASTKSEIMVWAKTILPSGISFVGGHPMAGKETSGIGGADADLFRNCVYCISPSPESDNEPVEYLKKIVTGIGAIPVIITPEKHDKLVAAISHLPFLISEALMSVCAGSDSWNEMAQFASSGFRDMTRLASGDPVMYRDICATNQKEINSRLDEFVKEIQKLKSLLQGDPGDLVNFFSEMRRVRQDWIQKR
ncbi:MAG: prephenate dehydrogenase/arogenate dehydrogenase family protein [Dehalococcoidia bacterium]|nr:prephenate dehydrogenase/arogenate dehydrogenase family protein [Dehalococcoidia bacterium]